MRKLIKRAAALLLAAVLLTGSTLPLYARAEETEPPAAAEDASAVTAETEDVQEAAPAAEDEQAEESLQPAETESGTEDAAQTEQPAEADTPEASEASAEDTDAEENSADGGETAAESEANAAEEAQQEEDVFPGMGEDYVLTAAEKADKAALTVYGTAEAAEEGIPDEDYIEGEVFFLAADETEALAVAAGYGAELESYESGVAVLKLAEGITAAQAIAAAADMDSNLPAVSLNEIVTAEPVSEKTAAEEVLSETLRSDVPALTDWQDWGLNEDPYLDLYSDCYQWQHAFLHDYAAWNTTQGSSEVVVAVVDSGIDDSHVELAGKVIDRAEFLPEGYTSTSLYFHGTHVAGIIAAAYGNGEGGSGVAPGVSLMDVRVLKSNGAGTLADTVSGINYAAENGADIINLSVGGHTYSADYEDAVENALNKGVAVIAAAGNDGTNSLNYPASFDGVIAVAALNEGGVRASYSNWGSHVAVCAPGSGIWSTTVNGGYLSSDGTSMACPAVTGAAALYLSAAGDGSGDVNGDGVRDAKDPAALKNALVSTGDKCTSSGVGKIVNAEKLLASVTAQPQVTVTVDGVNYASGATLRIADDSTAELTVTSANAAAAYFAYTLNGSKPAVSDGTLKNGTTYTEALDLTALADGTYTFRCLGVNGAGLSSSVVNVKFTIVHTGALELRGPAYAGKGKSVTLTVIRRGASGTLNWSVDEAAAQAGVKISSSGKLTVPAKADVESVTVTAALRSDPSVTAQLTLAVRGCITAIALSPAASTIEDGETLTLTAAVTAGSTALTAEEAGLSWVSSNPRIASVSADGTVTGVKTGSVTIYAKANDGSGKTAKCRVTVKVPAVQVNVSTTAGSIARGCKVSFSALALGVTDVPASNQKVIWSTDAAEDGVTIKNGTLYVPADFAGSIVTVTAQAADGSGAEGSCDIYVTDKVSALTLSIDDGECRGTYSRGVLKTVKLFSAAVRDSVYDETGSIDEREIELYVNLDDNVVWSSSNTSVAVVDEDGTVTAKRAGKAVITARANDGSNKRAQVTVQVDTPLSGLHLAWSGAVGQCNTGLDGLYLTQGVVAPGCAAKLQANTEQAFGTATLKKISWSIESAELYDKNGDWMDEEQTSWFVKKYLSLSSGKLYVSGKAKGYTGYVTVKAEQKESGVSDSYEIALTGSGTSFVKALTGTTDLYVEDGSGGYKWALSYTPTLTVSRGGTGAVLYFASDSPVSSFATEASNPAVQAVLYGSRTQLLASAVTSSSKQLYYRRYGKYYPVYKVYTQSRYCTGTSRITLTAIDGSGKNCSFTVRVTE